MFVSGRPRSRGGSEIVACIPAYNEEGTVARVILETEKYVNKIIVCDDGSTDLTGEIAKRLGALVIRHPRNLGVGAALRSLFLKALELGADVIVTLDADGQHDPSYIPKLVSPIIEGRADVVIGSRFITKRSREEIPLYRRLGIRILSILASKSSDIEVRDTQSGFRAYARSAVEKIIPTRNDFGWSFETLDLARRAGLRIIEVPVLIKYRGLKDTSTKNPLSHGMELLNTLIDLVTWRAPLLYLGLPGMLSLGVSLYFALSMLSLFNRTRYFSLPMTLLATAFGLAGITLITTSIVLYAIKKAWLYRKEASTYSETL